MFCCVLVDFVERCSGFYSESFKVYSLLNSLLPTWIQMFQEILEKVFFRIALIHAAVGVREFTNVGRRWHDQKGRVVVICGFHDGLSCEVQYWYCSNVQLLTVLVRPESIRCHLDNEGWLQCIPQCPVLVVNSDRMMFVISWRYLPTCIIVFFMFTFFRFSTASVDVVIVVFVIRVLCLVMCPKYFACYNCECHQFSCHSRSL